MKDTFILYTEYAKHIALLNREQRGDLTRSSSSGITASTKKRLKSVRMQGNRAADRKQTKAKKSKKS